MLTTKSKNNIHHLIDKNYRFRIKDALDIYTFLLYLDALDQHRRLILHRDHYFVVEQEGRLRFFKGGEARR